MRHAFVAAVLALGASFSLDGCAWFLQAPRPDPSRAVPSAPRAAPTVEPSARPFVLPAPTRLKLSNGLAAWSVQRRSSPLVSLRVVVRAGARHEEPEFPGSAAVTAEMLRRGAGSRSARAYQAALDATGGRFDVTTGPDATTLTATVMRRDAEAALALLADAVQDPWLEPHELAEVCREELAAIDGLRDDGDGLADALLQHVVLRGHPYEKLPSRRAIDALMRSDVRRFHRRWYRPDRTHITLVGDLAPADVKRLVTRRFGSWRPWERRLQEPAPVPPPSAPARLRVWVLDLDATQSFIRMGAPLPGRPKLNLPQLDALNFVLGGDFTSRLNAELRDREGLAYGAYSRIDAWREAGMFSARVDTRTETTRRAVDRLLAVVRGLRRTAPSRDEAETARRYLSGSFPMRFETSGSFASELSELALMGVSEDSLAGYRDALRAVSPGSLYRQARGNLPDQGLHLVVVGRASQVVPALRGLGPIQVLKRDALFR